MTREEFIDANWDEALVIDAKMREAAAACVKNFLDEEQAVESVLSKDAWLTYEVSGTYFTYLAYCYSLTCLGDRFLKGRKMVECLFLEVILQCSLGAAAVIVVNRDDIKEISFAETVRPNHQNGPARLQVGQVMLRSYFDASRTLPESHVDMQFGKRRVLRSLLSKLLSTLFRKGRTESEKLETRKIEAEAIQIAVAKLADRWEIKSLPDIDPDGWMFEASKGPKGHAES